MDAAGPEYRIDKVTERRSASSRFEMPAPSAVLCLLFVTITCSLLGADRVLTVRIAAEIDRIEQGWRQSPVTPGSDLAGIASAGQESLASARAALKSGRPYLALERLVQAADLFNAIQEIVAKTDAVKTGLPAFETEWASASASVLTLTREAPRAPDASPAVIRALAETSTARTGPLLDGARGFAAATGPKDGLLYIGEARGQAEFARFCAALPARREGRGWPARSMLAELMDLQQKADAAFRPPRSIEQHSRFIALNSTLKLARELDSNRRYYGSLYQYLEAVRHFAMLDAPGVGPEEQASLREAIVSERRRLSRSGRDDSILELFFERVEAQLSAGERAPSPDEWRNASILLREVIPAYAQALNAQPEMARPREKAIDVTLVRWPYT